jgi:hypothetical protein
MDWSLCAWCGKDFERREIAAAVLEPASGRREASGRIAATASAPAQIRPSVRTPMAAGGSARKASAQDPLPER